jgi:hypothetical protein
MLSFGWGIRTPGHEGSGTMTGPLVRIQKPTGQPRALSSQPAHHALPTLLPQHPRHGRPRRLCRGHLLRHGRARQGPVRQRRVQAQDDLGGRHPGGVLLLRGQLARVPREMRKSCANRVFLRVLIAATVLSTPST